MSFSVFFFKNDSLQWHSDVSKIFVLWLLLVLEYHFFFLASYSYTQ